MKGHECSQFAWKCSVRKRLGSCPVKPRFWFPWRQESQRPCWGMSPGCHWEQTAFFLLHTVLNMIHDWTSGKLFCVCPVVLQQLSYLHTESKKCTVFNQKVSGILDEVLLRFNHLDPALLFFYRNALRPWYKIPNWSFQNSGYLKEGTCGASPLTIVTQPEEDHWEAG